MWRRPRMADAALDQGDARAQAEAHYLRMSRLRQMSYDELRALLSGDAVKAAPWIASAARYGLIEAQVRLGQMFLDGVGVPRDDGAGLSWFLCAAKKGSCEAMNMAGRCYENGWGVEEDVPTAARWYRASADAGYDWGQYNYAQPSVRWARRGSGQRAGAHLVSARRGPGSRPGDEPAGALPRGRLGNPAKSAAGLRMVQTLGPRRLFPGPIQLRDRACLHG